MEIFNVEVEAVQSTESRAAEQTLIELGDLHLALIGGGIGDVVVG